MYTDWLTWLMAITLGGYRAGLSLSHAARSRAVTVASLHELKPKAVFSFSAVLRQVSFGLHDFAFPPGPMLIPSLSRTSPLSRTQVFFPWIRFPIICSQLSRAPVVSNRFWVCDSTVLVQNVISDDWGTNWSETNLVFWRHYKEARIRCHGTFRDY